MNEIKQDFKFTDSQMFILQNHYSSCPIHPRNWLTSLSNSTKVNQQLQCVECIAENPNQNIVSLSNILNCNQSTIFKNWPINDGEEFFDKLNEISNRKSQIEEYQQKIYVYFKFIRDEINKKISQQEIKMMNQAKSLELFKDQILISYNQYSGKDQLKDIIINKKDSFEVQNKLLKSEIKSIFLNLQRNKQSLLNSLCLLKTKEDMINFNTPKELNNILQQIQNINMFGLEDSNENAINNIEDDFKYYKNKIMKMKPTEMTTSQLMIQIMSNKLNNYSSDIIDNLNKIIIRISSFLDKQKLQIPDNVPFELHCLDDVQIKNIQKLITKITELNKKFGDDYIKGNILFQNNEICCRVLGQFDQVKIKQLFIDYPILQFLDLTVLKKIKIDFMKTKYQNSQNLILEVNQQGNPIVKQPKSLWGQIVTKDCLDPNLNYIFRCKLNKYLHCQYIDFGIMLTQNVNQKPIYRDDCCFETSSTSYGLDKIIKGKNLYEVRGEINELEIRVNINRQVLMFTDYPNYKNINCTNPEKIDNKKQYSFGFYFSKPGDDYIIQITDIFITDDSNFDKFYSM